jgi:beta-glucosidase-like glycosyl hydrolase
MATSTAVSVPAITGDARVDLLLARMSLTDKLRLLEWAPDRSVGQGKAARLRGIPRLGVPTLRLVDGLPGEASGRPVPAMTAPLGVAATFSRADAYANGTATGRDARALGEQVVALPFADLVRDPAWSQTGSTFGEDPLLAGQTAAAEIAGIQSQHTMALAKDYIGADGSANVVLDSQTLHEIYLQPFAAAARARVSAIMCARGTVSVVGATPSGAMSPGIPDCDNAGALTEVLRREMGFAGFVTSDWGANPTTQSLNSGLDMEMPGPRAAEQWRTSAAGAGASRGNAAFFSPRAIRAAIADGSLSLGTVNQAAGAVLAEMDRFGLLGTTGSASAVPTAADDGVAFRTAQDAATLLKNTPNALPLTARDLASLALIGPGAGQIIADGQTAGPYLNPAGSGSGVRPGQAMPGPPAPGTAMPSATPSPSGGTSTPSATTPPTSSTPTPGTTVSSTASPGALAPRAVSPMASSARAVGRGYGRRAGSGQAGAGQAGGGQADARQRNLDGLATAGHTQQPGRSRRQGQAGRTGAPGYSAALVNAGTYQVLSQYLRNEPRAHLSYSAADDLTGALVPASALSHEGEPGLVRTSAGSGATRVVPFLNNTLASGDALPPGSGHAWAGELTVPVTGTYWLDLGLLGAKGSLNLDGATIAQTRSGPDLTPRRGITQPTSDSVFPTTDGLDNLRAQVTLTAGTHIIGVSEVPDSSGRPVQVRLDWVTPDQQQAELNAAVAAATHARTAVVFAWSDGGPGSPLPEGQDQLIEDVAAVNPHTIVVLNTPGPVPMPWIASVKAVLQMWHPGAAGGEATANVLLGWVDPAGRLPVTWPASVGQGVADQPRTHPERTSAGVDAGGRLCRSPTPTATGVGECTSTYSEGIFVGYRWYDERRLVPLFPFGYGISYTHFAYSGLSWWTAMGGSLAVRFRVTNTGRVAGQEVPQVYLGPPASPPPGVAFAPKALAAYTRVSLRPHQSKVLTLYVPPRQFQYWDEARGWVTAPGSRPLYVGPNERTAYFTASVTASG